MLDITLLTSGPWSLHFDAGLQEAQLRCHGRPLLTVETESETAALVWAADLFYDLAQAASDELTRLNH